MQNIFHSWLCWPLRPSGGNVENIMRPSSRALSQTHNKQVRLGAMFILPRLMSGHISWRWGVVS